MRGRACSLAWMQKHQDYLLDESITQEEKASFLCFSRSEVGKLISALNTQRELKKQIKKRELTPNDVQKDDTPLVEKDLDFDKVAPTHYAEISKAPEEKQLELIQEVLDKGLTTKQVRQKVKDIKEEKVKASGFASGVEWADYQLNISYGCTHNCSYCYGHLMNNRQKWVEEWTEPRIRRLDLQDLVRKIEKLDAGTFMFCSVTDPYQPINADGWAKEVLEVLLNSKHNVIVLTKSALVERDLEFLSQYDNVELGFTITCLDDEANKQYEPESSPPSERARILKKAHAMGIKTLVSIEPWIIGHTEPLEILKLLKDDVDRWIIGVANYMGFALEEYRPYVGDLITYLVENDLNYWLKAELVRILKSYPIMSRKSYENTARQQVGDR